MTNKRTTRHALLTSLLSLLLCVSMLVGTTFAWFTDSVTSGLNKIVAGNLDVDVYYGDPALEQSIEGVSTLFNDVKLWEPGAMAWEQLTIVNEGTLALKYNMTVNFSNATDNGKGKTLADILQVAIMDEKPTRENIKTAKLTYLKNFNLGRENVPMQPGASEGFYMAIYWAPSAIDNEFNMNNGNRGKELSIDLGIKLVATQLTSEKDSFDENYDAAAQYPIVATGTMEPGSTEAVVLTSGRVTVTVPAGSPAGNYKLSKESFSTTEDENENVVLDTNFGVVKDGAPVDGVTYQVQIEVAPMATITKLTHKGEEITNYSYDPFTGIIEFETTSFSPFAVEYTVFGEEVKVKVENRTITKGFFKGVNPADLDATLKEDASAYMVVDYEQDGKRIYAVSEKATTVILGSTDAESYVFENGTYAVKPSRSGKLYSEISALKDNAHSTVYLLPGTYKEGTTINVYSSMDIIGLGERDAVKVIKTSSSSSNRHLFNCNGSKADHIEVTIRNMYLDATAKTTNNKDNAAVQAIRKTKVKCYDLTIVKGTGWDAVAFYVNGNNAVDGVKYPAYLYAENCTLNTTGTIGIVTTSGSHKFWHNGLTYNNGASTYTKNSGSIKNCEMAWDNWDWE